ncbi:uncharacterized protein LOC113756794 [Coffea eugenioides]|uniref:uncharacterized protein LOC113756794 n=1 Tax=Coffea eugenioides TaxID=49369 RepID=UPI000F6110E6|nr:uncharacterized protein LOC113756794 [Coffea eugenioides]
MARGGRKCKRTANGLRDEPIEQPPSCHETRQQPPLGTSHENVIEQVQGEAARAPQSPIQNSTLGIMHESGDQVTQQADGGKETTNDSSEVHQKTRGPTFMKEIWGRPKDFPRIEIKLDDNGIPISEKTSFSEFLGSLARNGMYCPIDVESWLKMPRKLKMDMLEVIKERFALPMGLEAWTLRSIGKKWRSWKADLKATYFDPAVPNAEARFQKDIRVREEQWIKLWAYWKSKEAKAKQLGRPPTRVEIFNKFYTHADGTPSSTIVAENSVVGQDKHGHVRLFSDGVNPTDLWEDITSRNTCYHISVQQQSTLVRLEERLQRQDDEIASLKKMVGNMVSLKSLFDPTKIVAKGYLRSLNPLDEVGGQALGPNWCEIQIQVAMSLREQLIRPYDLQQTIQDALGAPISWPCHLVRYALKYIVDFWNFSSSYDDLMIALVFVYRWKQLKNDGDFMVMTEDSQQNGKFGS